MVLNLLMGRVHHVDRPREDLHLLRAGLPGDMGEDHPGERMKRPKAGKCAGTGPLHPVFELAHFVGNLGGTVEYSTSSLLWMGCFYFS